MADPVEELLAIGKGIVVIEKSSGVTPVIAVNYAHAIGATVLLVEPLKTGEEKEIQYFLAKSQNSFPDSNILLEEIVNSRVGNVNFNLYSYGTFFTSGVPYSTVLRNVIPFSHVHLHLKMDFFLFNGIFYELGSAVNSAIVFSPGFFKESEETVPVGTSITNHRYFLRQLLNEEATAHNLDMHVKEYPFDLLHICSHGGDVAGEYCSLRLIDAEGETHTLEFDVVISFYPANYY